MVSFPIHYTREWGGGAYFQDSPGSVENGAYFRGPLTLETHMVIHTVCGKL